jgi:hypothetical protein
MTTSSQGHDFIDDGAVVCVLQIGSEAFPISIICVESRAVAVQFQIRDVELAAQVASLGPPNFDHASTQVREPQRCRGPARNWLKSMTSNPSNGPMVNVGFVIDSIQFGERFSGPCFV